MRKTQNLNLHNKSWQKLAGCSRGTINNRKWPAEHLKRIKHERVLKKELTTNLSVKATEGNEQLIERYKTQLFNSREELLAWKNRHDEKAQRVIQLEDINLILLQRIEHLESHLKNMKTQNALGKLLEIVSSNGGK